MGRTGGKGKDAYTRDKYHARSDSAGESEGSQRYSRDRYSSRNVQDDTTVSEYSRDNARRYSDAHRHQSLGSNPAADALKGAGSKVASLGGGYVTIAGRQIRVLPAIVAALLVIFLLAIVMWYAQVSSNMRPSEDVSASVTSPGLGQPYYVLLFGSDSRNEDDDVARADSIMLCRVDESNKQVTLISMPRDLRVNIEGQGYGKLNSTLTYNGFSGAIDAVSDIADVPISYYATIYFSGFEQLVDDLGGVTVEVPKGTYYKGVTVPHGKAVEINGKEALVLARCRHGKPADKGAYAAGDYQRTKNQRNLMKAIAKKILTQPAWAIPGQVTTVSECIETNIPTWKLAKIAASMRGMDTDSMYTVSAPATSQYIDGVSYEILDEAAWAKMMARVEAGEDPNE